MHYFVTARQLVFCFCIITLLFSCVLGVHSIDNKPKTCCSRTSEGRVPIQLIKQCAYTHKSGKCLEAYVFSLKNGKHHCSSVKAKGINATLANLEKKGIMCLDRPKS